MPLIDLTVIVASLYRRDEPKRGFHVLIPHIPHPSTTDDQFSLWWLA